MLREFTRNGATLLLGCWVKHWHVNYSKYVRKTRWKWGGHVGVQNYLSYKRQKAQAISLLCALSPSFETNLPAFIKCSTVKYNRRPHNQGQNFDTCKTILLVCECSLIKITFRPIMFGCTFNTTVFSKSRCRLIKLCYFEANNKLSFLEWFNKLRNVKSWHGRPCGWERLCNCGDGDAGKALMIVSMWVKITREFRAPCQRMRGARWDQAWLLKLILITEPSFHKRCSRAELWFIFHPSLRLQRTHCS